MLDEFDDQVIVEGGVYLLGDEWADAIRAVGNEGAVQRYGIRDRDEGGRTEASLERGESASMSK